MGLLLGGVLTDADLFGSGWRAVFLVNVPVAAVTLVAGLVLVPATRERSAGRPDVLGSLVLAGSLVAIVLPLVRGHAAGWPLWGWGCLAAGVLALGGLGVVEGRRRSTAVVPLLPARAFRLPAFSVGVLVQLLFSVGVQGFFLVFAVWLQDGEGYTPMQAGLVTVAFSAGGFLTAPVADRLAARFGRLVLAAGALLMAGGFAWVGAAVAGSGAEHTGAWPLAPGLGVAGAGLGLLVVPLVNVVLSAVPADLAGGASGIFATAQQFGGALGAAVIGTVFFDRASGGPAGGGLTDALGAALPWVIAGFLACAALCAALPRRAAGPAA
ncbi:MFS transporter [Streptomyces sp. PmtG]